MFGNANRSGKRLEGSGGLNRSGWRAKRSATVTKVIAARRSDLKQFSMAKATRSWGCPEWRVIPLHAPLRKCA
jgi:hypothetical protein